MGQMENLYTACTFLGTAIFALLFINYYIDSKNDEKNETENKKKK